jgi:hypothetical protein
MDELGYLRSRIPAYADYEDEDGRHLVDKQVRAYVGEALSLLGTRLGKLPAQLADGLEKLTLMCEFTDQGLMHVMDHAHFVNGEVEHLHEVDHELITAADRAAELELAMLESYLAEVEALFARRAKAVFSPT